MWYSVSGGMEFENVRMTYFLRQALLQRVSPSQGMLSIDNRNTIWIKEGSTPSKEKSGSNRIDE